MKYLKQSIRFFSETNPHLYMRARDLGVLADRCVRPTDKLILLFKTTWGKNHNLEEKITTWRGKNHNLEEKITTWRGKNYNLEGKNHKLKRKKITTWRGKYHNLEEIMTFGGNCTSGPCWVNKAFPWEVFWGKCCLFLFTNTTCISKTSDL